MRREWEPTSVGGREKTSKQELKRPCVGTSSVLIDDDARALGLILETGSPGEVSLQVGFELLDGLTVHPGRTVVGFDRFIRFVHSPLLDHEGLICRICRRHPVSSCSKKYDRLTWPLRSSPITEPSTLLRTDPSQSPASVSRLTVWDACVSPFASGNWFLQFRAKSLWSTHAPSTPVAVRPVIRLLTDSSQKIVALLVSTTPVTITTRHRRVCFHSSSEHSPAQDLASNF
jgi:hypothetical protein